MIIIVANYKAGKDAAQGFKNKYNGEVVDEIYVPLGQLDYAAETSRSPRQTPKPFTPSFGGMGAGL